MAQKESIHIMCLQSKKEDNQIEKLAEVLEVHTAK